MEKQITVEYNGSVSTPAGWRSVSYKGTAWKISEKRCRVIEITEIDGEAVEHNMSRTGAERQQFNGVYFADAEKGKIKNISSLRIIAE